MRLRDLEAQGRAGNERNKEERDTTAGNDMHVVNSDVSLDSLLYVTFFTFLIFFEFCFFYFLMFFFVFQ